MRFNLTEKEYKEYKTKIMLILKVKRMCIHYLFNNYEYNLNRRI
jgi:hypothetical protein